MSARDAADASAAKKNTNSFPNTPLPLFRSIKKAKKNCNSTTETVLYVVSTQSRFE